MNQRESFIVKLEWITVYSEAEAKISPRKEASRKRKEARASVFVFAYLGLTLESVFCGRVCSFVVAGLQVLIAHCVCAYVIADS